MASQAKILDMEEKFRKREERARIKEDAIRQENDKLKRMLREAQASSVVLKQPEVVMKTNSQPPPKLASVPGFSKNLPLTPARKRHSSQQLESRTKDCRISGNRFEVLTQPDSFEDTDTPVPSTSKSYSDAVLTTSSGITSDFQPVASSTQFGLLTRVESAMDPNQTGLVEGLFDVRNDGGLREEIEILLEKLNGQPFRGTVTQLEAKHGIYAECLGFGDFDNFDGVRVGFRRCPTLTFKLKTAINVDALHPIQFFEFKRRTGNQGSQVFDIISCRIKGLRPPQRSSVNMPKNTPESSSDDGTRTITVEGCEYRVPKETLIGFLSCYGEITSDILEVAFKDDTTANSGGTNRTGTYSCQVRLEKELPQLAPIMGKRIRFYYKGIQKLCTNCFGPHPKKHCRSGKVEWMDYVEHFVNSNGNVPREVYGRWTEYLSKRISSRASPKVKNNDRNCVINVSNSEDNRPAPPKEVRSPEFATAAWLDVNPIPSKAHPSGQSVSQDLNNGQNPDSVEVRPNKTQEDPTQPTEKGFGIPVGAQEYKDMIDRLVAAGTLVTEAEQMINSRKVAFNKACREHKKLQTGKQTKGMPRKQTRGGKHANQSIPLNGN